MRWHLHAWGSAAPALHRTLFLPHCTPSCQHTFGVVWHSTCLLYTPIFSHIPGPIEYVFYWFSSFPLKHLSKSNEIVLTSTVNKIFILTLKASRCGS